MALYQALGLCGMEWDKARSWTVNLEGYGVPTVVLVH